MTIRPFTCDDFDATLAALLEEELDAAARGMAESHASGCVRCGRLLADLGEVRSEAARLPVLRPSRDLWDGIAERIEAPAVDLSERREVREWQRPSRLAAAAVLLIAATATTTWTIARQGAEASSVGDAAPVTLVASDADAALAVRLGAAYEPEIAELRAVIAERPPALDAETMRVLEENIRIIDEAIGRSRAALAEVPGNAVLARQLVRAYDRKLETLRRIAAVPAE
jgi:hypothetical protein